MNKKNIDPKIAAAVLRRYQEIAREHSVQMATKMAIDQGLPKILAQQLEANSKKISMSMQPKLDFIMDDLESGRVDFDATTLILLEFGIKASIKAVEETIEITQKYCEDLDQDETQ